MHKMKRKKVEPVNDPVLTEIVDVELDSLTEENQEPIVEVPPCGAWCFILGAAAGAFCAKHEGHENEHETKISVLVEPKSEFRILWALEK